MISVMAQKTVVSLIDDLDGESEADETVEYALDGVTYEIDLTNEHAETLREVFAPTLKLPGVPVAALVPAPAAGAVRRAVVVAARARAAGAAMRSRRFVTGPRAADGRSATGGGCRTMSSRRTTPLIGSRCSVRRQLA
jgi:Lsr2